MQRITELQENLKRKNMVISELKKDMAALKQMVLTPCVSVCALFFIVYVQASCYLSCAFVGDNYRLLNYQGLKEHHLSI
jgi:ABC-type uncharacterized transport system permease subunit